MTITIPTTLGPSWPLRVAGLLGAIGAIGEVMPDTLPGAAIIKPWTAFSNAAAIALIGFYGRANLVSTEQAIARNQGLPVPPSPPVTKLEPPKP